MFDLCIYTHTLVKNFYRKNIDTLYLQVLEKHENYIYTTITYA